MNGANYESMEEILEIVLKSARSAAPPKESTQFARDLDAISLKNVFENLWLREGLDRRARSLVTLGILIALRARDELKIHSLIAIENGVTIEEIEEILYHSTAYVGFPGVNLAKDAIAEAIRYASVS